MGKLPLPLLLLCALLATAVPAQADPLPPATLQLLDFEFDEEEADAGDSEAEEPWEEEDEACEFDPEEPEFCEEVEAEGEDECLLEDARAKVVVNPGKRRLLLTVHYRAVKPASVTIATVLRGAKGAVRLGTGHARFRRAGVYRDSFRLAEKQTRRARAARKLDVDLRVVNSPRYCGLHLNEAVRRPKR